MGNQANSRVTAEVEQFDAIGGEWWDEQGPFKPLHMLNPARMAYLLGQIAKNASPLVIPAKAGIHGAGSSQDIRLKLRSLDSRFRGNDGVVKGLKILDIACGGGLVCEPLARLGARVTGIDTSKNAIAAARAHAAGERLDINYICSSLEEFIAQGVKGSTRERSLTYTPIAPRSFDIITALEILEHVADPADFIASAKKLLKPGGTIIFSTLNRTVKSMLFAKIAAEEILGIVPRGTHQWSKFIQPAELAEMCEAAGLKVNDITGLVLNPLRREFALSKTDVDINYFLTASA